MQVLATEEGQTFNAFGPLLEMLRDGPACDVYPGLEPMQSFVALPYKGKIEFATSAATSKEGGKPVMCVLDQALALDTPIPTPIGWTTMGELVTGDVIYGSAGPVRVSEAKPVSDEHDCYRLTFQDGTEIVASAGHLWWSKRQGDSSYYSPKIRTTEEMSRGKFRVPVAPVFTLPRKKFRVKQHNRSPEWMTIRSIVPVPRVPVRCIAVDSEDHLFAAGVGGHLTHNTEAWTKSNGGIALAATVRRNLAKTGGTSIEAPNAYLPGDESVAEHSAAFYQKILEGKAREEGLLYDHREWPADTDMTDRESLLAGLAYVYGESADVNGGWVDLERLVGDIWDPDADPQDSRRFFGNQITHATDSWVSQPQMAATARPLEIVADGEMIALGFDGSRHRSDTVTDATALIGVRISDGLIFPIGIWEQPDNEPDWWAPTLEIDAAVKGAFKQFNVVAFYADPAADWRSYVANWEATYGEQLRCKVSATHPIEWWMGGQNLTKTVQALKQLHSAIVHQQATHDGSSALIRHFLNARRRQSRVGLTIAKPYPESPRKIDAAVASTLAWQARLDVISRGVHTQETKKRSNRIRRY